MHSIRHRSFETSFQPHGLALIEMRSDAYLAATARRGRDNAAAAEAAGRHRRDLRNHKTDARAGLSGRNKLVTALPFLSLTFSPFGRFQTEIPSWRATKSLSSGGRQFGGTLGSSRRLKYSAMSFCRRSPKAFRRERRSTSRKRPRSRISTPNSSGVNSYEGSKART